MKRIDCERTLPLDLDQDIELNTGNRFEHTSSTSELGTLYSDHAFPIDWLFERVDAIIERFTQKPAICEATPSTFIESHVDVDALVPYQRYTLDSTESTRVIDGHRAVGRTMTCIWDVVYSALRYPDITISVVCPVARHVKQFVDELCDTLQQLVDDYVDIPTVRWEYPFSMIRPAHYKRQSTPETVHINNGVTIHGLSEAMLADRPGSNAHRKLQESDLCVVDTASYIDDKILLDICSRSISGSSEYNLLLSTTEIVDAMNVESGMVVDVPESTRGQIRDDHTPSPKI